MTSPKRSGRSSEDGLPSGWSVSVRVRSSGKKDRKYYAPSGLKFNSKVEVTRYLKTLDGVSLQPNEEKHAESDGAPEYEKEDEMRIKETVENHICKGVERSSSSPGEKDNAGFEKSINLRGSSVKDGENTMIEENVAQFQGLAASPECKGDKYVNDQNSVSHIKQIGSLEDKQTSLKHAPNVGFERVVAEGLPAGWIKEVKLTKKKNIVRRDPYYIDPVSGYIFRSMRDALRYLATGDIGRLAFKPKEESPNAGLESGRSSLHSEAKRQKHSGMEGTEDERSEQVSHLTDDQMLESVYKEATPPPPDSTRPDLDQGNSTDEQRYACDRTNGVPDSGTEFPQDKHGFMDGTTAEISETPKAKQATLKSGKKKSSDLPRRTSSRLAGLVANPKMEVTRTCQATGNGVKDEQLNSGSQKKRFRRGKMSRSINELCSPVEDKLDNRRIGDEKKKETQDEERKKLEDDALPYQKLVLPFELPSGDILSDPCIEFAIKTLTGVSFDTSSAIKSSSAEQHTSVLPSKVNNNGHMDKVSEMASSSLNLPFVDSWQDPCIEFAIKTLTGAIPVDFDSDIPDLMRQQMNSSQIQERTESNARVDNFCRTDLLWQHSEAADKNGFRQQNGTTSSTQPLNVNMKRPSSSILR